MCQIYPKVYFKKKIHLWYIHACVHGKILGNIRLVASEDMGNPVFLRQFSSCLVSGWVWSGAEVQVLLRCYFSMEDPSLAILPAHFPSCSFSPILCLTTTCQRPYRIHLFQISPHHSSWAGTPDLQVTSPVSPPLLALLQGMGSKSRPLTSLQEKREGGNRWVFVALNGTLMLPFICLHPSPLSTTRDFGYWFLLLWMQHAEHAWT